MNKVAILPFPEIENAYVIISATQKDPEKHYGEYFVNPIMTFFYDAGNVGIEWEPEHGAIQVWNKCEKDDVGAKEHWFFDYQNSPGGSWSQLAVSERELPQAFVNGDYKYIFNVLKEWAR